MAKITGTGYYVPANVVTNDMISKANLWIVENTGIKERRICKQGENSSFLGGFAVKEACINAGLKLKDIELLIVATATPDKLSPSTACIIKDELEMDKAVAFDISAVCSGFLFGMSVADSYINSGAFNNAVVVGVDCFSSITDWSKRDCIFFGDGAGAVVLTKGNNFLGFSLYSDSVDRVGFYCDHGKKFTMNTTHVYNTAVRVLPIAIEGVMKKCGICIDEIDYIVPHQPSKRILIEVADILGIKIEKVLMNMESYGNTVAGTIPILLHESWEKFKEGEIIVFAAIGSGWTYGAAIYEV